MDVQGGSFHRAPTYQMHDELCDYSKFHGQFNNFPPSHIVVSSSYSNYSLNPRDMHQPPCVVGMWRLGMNGYREGCPTSMYSCATLIAGNNILQENCVQELQTQLIEGDP